MDEHMAGQGRTVLIMAGGTGGHVFPALAVARELLASGHSVHWLGTRRGIESDVIPAANIPIHYIDVAGLRGKGVRALLGAPLQLLRAVSQALRVVREVAPNCVLGMGGFAAGPGGVAARLRGIPLVIHEQNSIAGLTNRLLAMVATRVLEAFGGAFGSRRNVESVGNPVRAELLTMASPEQRVLKHGGRPRLLVLGGSLGAVAINELVPAALGRISAAERPDVWHQSGKRHLEKTLQSYADAGVDAQVVPFIEKMESAYLWADLVLCRAGAMTVSELGVAGLGALFVPFPHAVDDHQTGNARFLADAGAALVLQQSELTAAVLAETLLELLRNPARIESMAASAYGHSSPKATQRVAQICLEVARG